MASIKGTKTEQNLLKSFAGESQARARYQMFAEQAEKEGFRQIAAIFMETADNERIHGSRFFSFLEGGELEITAAYPAGKVGTTLENLKASAMGENEEWSILYPEFARIAREEGFPKVAATFEFVAKAEVEHENRFNKLAENVEKDRVFKRDEVARWKCSMCGYVHEGTEAPAICPTCQYPKEYYEIKETNY